MAKSGRLNRRPRTAPSLASIVATDYAALLSAIAPLVLGALAAAEAYGLISGKPFFIPAAAVVAAVAVPVLTWRVSSIRSLFARGVEVEGEVLGVDFYKDRGTVWFSFEHAGRSRETSCALHKTARAAKLEKGARVAVLFDPTNPSRALLPDLFG